MEEVYEHVLDKLAMEALACSEIPITYSADEFPAKLDELIVKNQPGHFPNVHWPIIPSSTTIFDKLLNTHLEIAETPSGNADSPVGQYFAKPHVQTRSFAEFLQLLTSNHRNNNNKGRHYYFQSQDNNLADLNCGAPKHLPLKSQFLGTQQAANLWIGEKGTTSRLHNDNYDNIYVQVSGTKRIYMLPPSSVADVNEKMLKPATYNSEMELVPDLDQPEVLFPTYDPKLEAKQNLVVVDLRPGDILFLPALWYHQVEITEGTNVSLNYWHTAFDDERRWSNWNLTRQLIQLTKN